MILIDKMEGELKDAKYKALSSSSTLTERCRESRVLKVLRQNNAKPGTTTSESHIADI